LPTDKKHRLIIRGQGRECQGKSGGNCGFEEKQPQNWGVSGIKMSKIKQMFYSTTDTVFEAGPVPALLAAT
jgi:hypothetical protein